MNHRIAAPTRKIAPTICPSPSETLDGENKTPLNVGQNQLPSPPIAKPMASALFLGQPPGLVIPPEHLGETPRARKRAFHQSVRRAKSFSARRGRVEILGQPPIAPLLSVDPRLGLPAGALQSTQFVHQIEDDLGLPTDRPVTAHLFLQAIGREPEPAGRLSVAQAEPINTGAQPLASLDPSLVRLHLAIRCITIRRIVIRRFKEQDNGIGLQAHLVGPGRQGTRALGRRLHRVA